MHHTFSNGLTIVGEPSDRFESAAFSFLVPTGAAYDPVGKLGTAELTCEMILRGSGERDSRQFVSDLDSLGAITSESVSVTHTRASSAALAKNIQEVLSIYAAAFREPHFSDDQFEPAKQLILQQLRSLEDEPNSQMARQLQQRFYGEPFGRPYNGELADVEKLTLDDVREFFANTYQPREAILAVAGNFDFDAMVRYTEGLFGDWEERHVEPSPEAPPAYGRTHLPYDSAQTHIGIAYPTVPRRDDDFLPASASVGILSSGMSSRLFTEVREKRGLCYSVSASYTSLLDRAAVFCRAGSSAPRAKETLEVILAELKRLADGIEEEELVKLKTQVKSSVIMSQESSSARSAVIARNWYHLGRLRTVEEVLEEVSELTAARINAYLKEHPPEDFTVVTLGSEEL